MVRVLPQQDLPDEGPEGLVVHRRKALGQVQFPPDAAQDFLLLKGLFHVSLPVS